MNLHNHEETCQECDEILDGDEMVVWGQWGLCNKCAKERFNKIRSKLWQV